MVSNGFVKTLTHREMQKLSLPKKNKEGLTMEEKLYFRCVDEQSHMDHPVAKTLLDARLLKEE